ncbi:MAG TPA: 6-bladed beta-propeller [Thermoanaerobaculia bacterium]|nr:6-bladed beta-propeller [Thermoanaerobaculia bacterium]
MRDTPMHSDRRWAILTRVVASLVSPVLLAGFVASACQAPGPKPVLSLEEEEFYRARQTFPALFETAGRVRLGGAEEHPLSARPLLKAITPEGSYIVLDKLNVRNVLVFARDGHPVGRIGREGRAPGEYIYPHNLHHDPTLGETCIYDGDLLRISCFAPDFKLRSSFTLPLFLDAFLVTRQGRIFGYSSSIATASGSRFVLHEVNASGQILKAFAPQSAHYSELGASEGGGVANVGDHLYTVTPYEYRVTVYSQDGKRVLQRKHGSPHYVLPPPPPALPSGGGGYDFQTRLAYHAQWSHILQILSIDDKMVGVVFAEPGEGRVLMDLLNLDLAPIVEDIELPRYTGDLLWHEGSLYFFLPEREEREGRLLNPTLARYRLASPRVRPEKGSAR